MKNSGTTSTASPPLHLLLQSQETHVETGNRKQETHVETGNRKQDAN
jgi:hypothetical protein